MPSDAARIGGRVDGVPAALNGVIGAVRTTSAAAAAAGGIVDEGTTAEVKARAVAVADGCWE